jgi:hypothetical protein
MIGDDIEGLQLAADTERSAVKVSMIRMNNEIIYQDGQLIHQKQMHFPEEKRNQENESPYPILNKNSMLKNM